MKKLFTSLVSCALTMSINAQSPSFQWAKQFNANGTSGYYPFSIKADALGNIYTTGEFAGTIDFDPGASVFNLTSSGSRDIFVSKLDVNGNLIWAKKIGSADYDTGYSLAIDNTGNAYITGYFEGSVDFDPNAGTFNLNSNIGGSDLFILKLNSTGNFVWAKSIGDSGTEHGTGIVLDAASNVYITGKFGGLVDFDPDAGVYTLNAGFGNKIFVLKLNTSGNFVWANDLPGKYLGNENGEPIAIDASGNIFTAGSFNAVGDFNPGVGVFNLTPTGANDAFVTKFDSNGNFVWANSIGGAGNNTIIRSIALDGAGNINTTGVFNGTVDFDPGAGTFNITGSSTTGSNVFISKLDATGSFIFAKHFVNVTSGNQVDAQSINADGLGNSYTLGDFSGTVDFDPGVGTASLTSISGGDMYITKLDANGNFVWAKQIGNAGGSITGYSTTTDLLGNIYSTGWFSNASTDFDPNAGVFNLTPLIMGGYNGFVQKMSQPTATGIEAYNSTGNEVAIYPNPNNGSFTINLLKPNSNTFVEIYNCLGALVYKSALANQQTPIDLTNQCNGIYFIKTINNNTVLNTQKIIKN